MNRTIQRVTAIIAAVVTTLSISSCSTSEKPLGAGDFMVSNSEAVATIFVSQSEPYSLRRAVDDVANDLEMVTGKRPKVCSDLTSISGQAIIIGTLKTPEIERLTASIAECKAMDKMVESFIMKPVVNPTETINSALLIAGSDALGAIYGAYELSELSGVSPLYWWLDSTPKRQEKLTLRNIYRAPKEPSVRYRAIFINDEEAMIKWSGNTTPNGKNRGITPETYKQVFELMLRLKANALWPSMMEAGRYFFEDKDENGVAINPRNATEYGVYVGTSHCENMARNNYDEWYGWAEANAKKYNIDSDLSFDYTINPIAIEAYWQERLDESKNFNMIYTLGIRGVHDSPMLTAGMKDKSLENRVKMLQTVISHQREMIKNTFGAEDAVPQIFVPYEETGELYNGESKNGKEKCKGLDIPEDVILVATEDNYGYVRQSPNERDLKRMGGNGIYYHLAYQGYPSPYDWLSLIPLTTVREQLRKVYDEGSTKFWIVNVGDIKPTEFGLKYFMETAWNLDAAYEKPTKQYMEEVMTTAYGVDQKIAQRSAELLTKLQQLACSQKPEFMSSFWSVDFYKKSLFRYYSHFDFGDEVLRIIESYKALESEAKAIYDAMDESSRAPFYHTLYYPIRAGRMMAEKSYYYQRNYHYAEQGRFRSAAAYKALSLRAEEEIDADLDYYNNHLTGGKWRGIMDPYGDYNLTERVYDIAGIPKKFIFSERFTEQAVESIGAVSEGQQLGTESVTLRFSSLEQNTRFIDIFTRGLTAQRWSAAASEPWVKLSKQSGSVEIEERIFAEVDYSKLTQAKQRATITITGGDGFSKSFEVEAEKFDANIAPRSFVEGCGFVSLEAEHFTRSRGGRGANSSVEWREYGDYGYVGSSMFTKSSERRTPAKVELESVVDSAACLEYDIYFSSVGEFRGMLYRVPTLNEGKDRSCELALGLNNEKPQLLQGVRHKGQFLTTRMQNGEKETRQWHTNVIMQMERIPFSIKVDRAGLHTLKLYQMDANIGVDRVIIATNKEAEIALDRSILGAAESYNNIVEYRPTKPLSPPVLTAEQGAIEPYPNPEPLIYTKYLFSQYGAPAVWGFTPVTVKDVYDPRINTHGWRADDLKNIRSTHNESTRVFPHWQRDMIMGRKPTLFSMKMLEGRYDVTVYTGTIRFTYAYNPAPDIQFTLKSNGNTVIDNELFKENQPTSRTFEARVGEDNNLELEFSGNWGVSMIELYRK